MGGEKIKKSFKKFATKHLAGEIERRRKTAKSRKELKERTEKKQKRVARVQAAEDAEHQADLDKLREVDPEFHSFLEEEDPSLLQYGEVDDDALDDAIEGSDQDTETDAGEEGEEEGTEGEPYKRVDSAEIEHVLQSKAVDPSVDLLLSAARELGVKLRGAPRASTTRKFESPDLVKQCAVKVARHIARNVATAVVTRDKKLEFKNRSTRDTMKRFMNAIVALLTECAGDVALVRDLADASAHMVRAGVVNLVKGCTKNVLKVCLNLASDQSIQNRQSGALVLIAIARRAAGTRSMYQSACFKGAFLALIRAANRNTIHTMPVLATLMNTVAMIYETDIEAAYQHAYVYIRQLAVYLRAALQNQSQNNVRTIFNWQFVVALRTWGMVLAQSPEPKALGPLIHPLVQVALGMMDLFNSPRMFPMHLHVIEVLNRIGTNAGVYIPVSPYLLRILTSPSLALDATAVRQANKDQQGGGATDLQFTLRVKKAEARSKTYKENVTREALYLLLEHLAANASSIGFPEAFWSVSATLSKLKREVKVPSVHNDIGTILQRFEQTARLIVAKRDQVTFGPCDSVQVKMFEDQIKSGGKIPVVQLFEEWQGKRKAAFEAKVRKVAEKENDGKGKGRRTLDAAVADAPRQKRAGAKRPRDEENDE